MRWRLLRSTSSIGWTRAIAKNPARDLPLGDALLDKRNASTARQQNVLYTRTNHFMRYMNQDTPYKIAT